jgi:hypothetical protein
MIKIENDEDNEMMKISFNNKVIFHGNYWDFDRDPDSIYRFLKKLNLKVELKKYDWNKE